MECMHIWVMLSRAHRSTIFCNRKYLCWISLASTSPFLKVFSLLNTHQAICWARQRWSQPWESTRRWPRQQWWAGCTLSRGRVSTALSRSPMESGSTTPWRPSSKNKVFACALGQVLPLNMTKGIVLEGTILVYMHLRDDRFLCWSRWIITGIEDVQMTNAVYYYLLWQWERRLVPLPPPTSYRMPQAFQRPDQVRE